MANLENAQEVANKNGVNPWTVRRLGAAGKISVYRCGSAVRYDPDEVRAFMAQAGEAQRTRPRPRGNRKENPISEPQIKIRKEER